jgi:hypothetical protein
MRDVPTTAKNVTGLVEEYEDLTDRFGGQICALNSQEDEIVAMLVKDHDWTEDGARKLITCVRQYGAFALRNALAIAIALDCEDGTLGI